LLERAGQMELSGHVRPLAIKRTIGGALVLAATDRLRVGGGVSGAALYRNGYVGVMDGGNRDTLRFTALYGEGSVGFESAPRFLRYGAFVGVGHGTTDWTFQKCSMHSHSCKGPTKRVVTRYVRTHALGYLSLTPSGPATVTFGVRVPVDHDLERTGARELTRVWFEPFLGPSLTSKRGLRADLQLSHARGVGVMIHVGMHVRLDASAFAGDSERARSAPARFLRLRRR
jgi:hypothetical protein